jgi:hypothetical protein
MLAFIDINGNLVQRVPNDVDLTHYDLTGLTVVEAESDDVLIPDLAAGRARQRAIIKAARDAAMQDNVIVPDMPTKGQSAEFQLRASTSSGRGGFDFIMGYVARAESALLRDDPYIRPFKLANNNTVEFNAAQWVAIGDRIETEMAARFLRGETLLARINEATTLAEITSVNWTLQD